MWRIIKRDLSKGENVLVVAHGNALLGLARIINGEKTISLVVGVLLAIVVSSNSFNNMQTLMIQIFRMCFSQKGSLACTNLTKI